MGMFVLGYFAGLASLILWVWFSADPDAPTELDDSDVYHPGDPNV